MFVAAVASFGLVQQQFFPTSTRTELFFELRLPEGTAIGVTDAAAKQGRAAAGRRPRHRHLHDLCRAGLAALLARAQPGAAEPELRPDRDRDQGPRGARARQGAARARARATARCRRRARGSIASTFGPPVGFPVQFRVDRARSHEGARHRRAGARGHGAEPQDHRSASQLGRTGQIDPPRGRSGPRPRARPHPAGRVADAADAAHRATPSRSTARASSTSTWSRARCRPSGSSSTACRR